MNEERLEALIKLDKDALAFFNLYKMTTRKNAPFKLDASNIQFENNMASVKALEEISIPLTTEVYQNDLLNNFENPEPYLPSYYTTDKSKRFILFIFYKGKSFVTYMAHANSDLYHNEDVYFYVDQKYIRPFCLGRKLNTLGEKYLLFNIENLKGLKSINTARAFRNGKITEMSQNFYHSDLAFLCQKNEDFILRSLVVDKDIVNKTDFLYPEIEIKVKYTECSLSRRLPYASLSFSCSIGGHTFELAPVTKNIVVRAYAIDSVDAILGGFESESNSENRFRFPTTESSSVHTLSRQASEVRELEFANVILFEIQ